MRYLIPIFKLAKSLSATDKSCWKSSGGERTPDLYNGMQRKWHKMDASIYTEHVILCCDVQFAHAFYILKNPWNCSGNQVHAFSKCYNSCKEDYSIQWRRPFLGPACCWRVGPGDGVVCDTTGTNIFHMRCIAVPSRHWNSNQKSRINRRRK
jgi:hypothetical protein